MVANNVLAHVPDLHDFIEGVSILLPPQAVASFEFPHLLQLMRQNQFDTIYHEHFSYFSLFVVQELLLRHGLAIYDVDELPTHGGSLRISVRHSANGHSSRSTKVERVLAGEREYGLHEIDAYRRFAARTVETKCALLDFFVNTRRRGKRVVGYGAPAKGNTLLNYCGIGPELLPFTVDRSPHKQGLLLPGTRIPVREPSAILEAKPDYLFILPWNLRNEIAEQMSSIRGWGGRFVVPIPELEVF